MANEKWGIEVIDIYEDQENCWDMLIKEENVLLLRDLDLAMENLSLKNRQEVISVAVEIFFPPKK